MKLIMTLLVRDEEDVLAANIDFHRAQGVDFFIVTDNRSEDATAEIIQRYVAEGIAHYIYEASDDYNQTAWVTRMARMAATDFAADWVINNDADEFWWPRAGTLKSTFESIPPGYTTLVGKRHDFVPVTDEQGSFLSDMIYRKVVSLNTKGNPLPPKVAHVAHPDVVVPQGNHWAELPVEGECIANLVDIFHFPIRRYAQFTNKIIKGGQAYERNTSSDRNVGGTWRELYQQYRKDGLVGFYREQAMTPAQIDAALRRGELVCDRRLADFLDLRAAASAA